MASPGHELVAFDISQADIRVLAHAADSFPYTGEAYLKHLQNRRLHRLGDAIAVYRQQMWQYFQPQNRKVFRCPHCSAVIEFTEKQAGTTIPCPACQGLVELPSRYPKLRSVDADAPLPKIFAVATPTSTRLPRNACSADRRRTRPNGTT